MPALKVTVLVEVDGQPVPGFPYVRRVVADEVQTFGPYIKVGDANGTTFTALPTSAIVTMQGLVVRADQDVTIRLNGQATAGVLLKAGGLLLILDSTIDAGATTNATINLNQAASVLGQVRGLAIGSSP